MRAWWQDLDQFNRERTVIYYTGLPAAFDALQALDESRAEGVVTHLTQFLACLRQSVQLEQAALEAARVCCEQFNKVEDSGTFARAHASGQPQPGDIPFDDILVDMAKRAPKPAPKPPPVSCLD
jgi:hypothetical protein